MNFEFDLSHFVEIGRFLFDSAVQLYKSLNFNFGDFTVNGWALMLGSVIVIMVVRFVARLFE